MNNRVVGLVSEDKKAYFLYITFFLSLLLSQFSNAKDLGSSEVLKFGLEIFSLVEQELEEKGLVIKSIEDLTARRGCEGAISLSIDGESKEICGRGMELNHVRVFVHNFGSDVWEVVHLGAGFIPGVKGIQENVCTERFRREMYEKGIEYFNIDTKMEGEDKNIASCFTWNYEGVMKEIYDNN